MIHKIRPTNALTDAGALEPPPVITSCRRCKRYNQCQHLCQAAEIFVNQDNLMFPTWFSLWGDVGSAKSRREVLGLKEMETDFAPVTGNRRPHSRLSAQEWRLLAGAGLSPRQEEVLFLYYWQAHSSREVAAILGLHHSAVDALLRRAKNRLRRHLARFLPENKAEAGEMSAGYAA